MAGVPAYAKQRWDHNHAGTMRSMRLLRQALLCRKPSTFNRALPKRLTKQHGTLVEEAAQVYKTTPCISITGAATTQEHMMFRREDFTQHGKQMCHTAASSSPKQHFYVTNGRLQPATQIQLSPTLPPTPNIPPLKSFRRLIQGLPYVYR